MLQLLSCQERQLLACTGRGGWLFTVAGAEGFVTPANQASSFCCEELRVLRIAQDSPAAVSSGCGGPAEHLACRLPCTLLCSELKCVMYGNIHVLWKGCR